MTDIARIGFFGKEYEVYVRTDDECQVPHFHVRAPCDSSYNAAVEFHRAHRHYLSTLTEQEQADLMAFLTQPCRSPEFANNFEFAVVMWNMNNYTEYLCETDEQGCILIPDYTSINPHRPSGIVVFRSFRRMDFDCLLTQIGH